MKPLFVSHWWGVDYAKFAKNWVENCKRYNLDHYVVQKRRRNRNNQEMINSKAKFIYHCLCKFDRPIVFTDIDMNMQRKPALLLKCSKADFVAPNWNADPRTTPQVCPKKFETISDVLYFNNTPAAKRLLKLWTSALETTQMKYKADDRVLAYIFHVNNASQWCKCKWLPVEYFYIPQYFSHLNLHKKAVFIHPHDLTSEEQATKNGADKNRIPKDYDKVLSYSMSKNAVLNNFSKPRKLAKLKKKT